MQKTEIEIGKEYVFRENNHRGTPIQHVKILEYIRGKKWKVEWIDPNPGLIDYIESQQLIIRWKDRKALLKDEENEEKLNRDNEKHKYEGDTPLTNAIIEIFESLGEKEIVFYRGELSGSSVAIERIKIRANYYPKKESEISFIDRFGNMHIPYAEALELAHAVCISEPSTVLLNVESHEREWVQKSMMPGNEYILSLLNEFRAAWAIIRQWTGYDAAISQKEAQIQRLERLVLDAIYALQKAGLDNEADRFRRAMQKK